MTYATPREGALTRRRFLGLAATGAALACTGLFARSALATEGVSEQTAAALSNAQSAYSQAMSQLASLTEQAETAQYNLSQTQASLDETNAAIDDLQASITQKQAELSDAQDALADRVNANYRAGKTDVLSVLLDASSFDDLVSRIYYAGKVSDSDAQAIQAVKDIKADLEQQ